MAVAFLGRLWIAATIQVEASGRCPAAPEIEAKLEPLLAGEGIEGPARRATIVEDRGELSIRLAELDGTVIAEKRLPTGGSASCAMHPPSLLAISPGLRYHPPSRRRPDRRTISVACCGGHVDRPPGSARRSPTHAQLLPNIRCRPRLPHRDQTLQWASLRVPRVTLECYTAHHA
jgi:hypothetical protein